MPTYNVLLVPAALVWQKDIEAKDPHEAIELAIKRTEQEGLPCRLDPSEVPTWDETNFVGYQVDEVDDHDYSTSQFYHDGYHEPIQALYQLFKAVEGGSASDVIHRDPRLKIALARALQVLKLCHPVPGVEA